MATIASTLKINDGMTPVFKSMMNSMNMIVSTFEDMNRASANAINVKGITAARGELTKAASAFKQIEDNINKTTGAQDKLNKSVSGMSGSSADAITGIKNIAGALGLLSLAAVGVGLIKESLSNAFDRMDTMDRFNRTITTMTGSTDIAKDGLKDLTGIVTGTAYGLNDAAQAAQNFVARGMDMKSATKSVKAWTDAVSFYGKGTTEEFLNVTDAITKMRTKGTVEMDQLNRLFDSGINAVGIYAQATGQMSGDVQDALSKGMISSNDFLNTVENAMETGANGVINIAGAALTAGDSWSGTFSKMSQAATRGMVDIVKSIDAALATNGLPTLKQDIADVGSGFEGTAKTVASAVTVMFDNKDVQTFIKNISTDFTAGKNEFNTAMDEILKKVQENTPQIEKSFNNTKNAWDSFFNTVIMNNGQLQNTDWKSVGDALGTGFSGALGVLTSVGAMLLNIGTFIVTFPKMIADLIIPPKNGLTGFLEDAQTTGIATQNVFIDLANAINGIFNIFGANIPYIQEVGGEAAGALASGMEDRSSEVYQKAQNIHDGTMGFINPITGELQQTGINGILNLSNGMFSQKPLTDQSALSVHDGIHENINTLPGELNTIGSNSIISMGGGIDLSAPIANAAAQGIYGLITGQLNPLGQFGTDTGGFLASGLSGGMSTWNAFTSATQGIVDFIKNAFLKGFDINSPSGFTTYVGEMLGQGLINSLSNTNLGKVATSLMGTLKEAFLQGRTNALSIFEHMGDMGSALLARMGISLPTLGNLLFPTDSQNITSAFGSRESPGGFGSTYHEGIDIGAAYGAAVRATAAGKVIFAGENGGYGNMVEIDHGNGLTTLYAHLSEIMTSVGAAVSAGQQIGKVGSSGNSTGPHLHYGVYENGVAVDPMTAAISGGSGDVGAWIQQAMNAIGITGQDNFNHLVTIAMNESGGDRNAQNNWDSNAMAGTPSMGLMQMIQSTFDAYSSGGSIWDPVSNAISAINYMIDRYGSILNTPTGGYAAGTRNATRGVHWVGENGPELMNFRGGETITNNKDSMEALSPEKAASLRGSSVSNNSKITMAPIIHIHMGDNIINNEMDIKKVVRLLGDELEEQLQISAAGIY